MNKKFLSALGACVVCALSANAQVTTPTEQIPYIYEGVGPVMSGSIEFKQMPKEAQDFVNKYFRDKTINRCEMEFDDRTYEVSLADRTDIEFDYKGRWTEVDAGGNRVLPFDLVKKLIPRDAAKEVERLKLTTRVETVKRSVAGYKVEFRGTEIDDIRFDPHGKLISIRLDD